MASAVSDAVLFLTGNITAGKINLTGTAISGAGKSEIKAELRKMLESKKPAAVAPLIGPPSSRTFWRSWRSSCRRCLGVSMTQSKLSFSISTA